MEDYINRIREELENKIFNGLGLESFSKGNEKLIIELYKTKNDFFDIFFDISYMSANQVYDFIFFDQEHKHIRESLLSILDLDKKTNYDYFHQYTLNNAKKEFIEIFNKSSIDFRRLYREFVKAMIWLELMPKNDDKTYLVAENELDYIDYRDKTENNSYYRGQANYNWSLSPSLLRGFYYEKNDGCVIDISRLYVIYRKTGLIDKYNKTMGSKKIGNCKDIDYDFLSFMQHSISFSPLIDFTSNIKIAYKFALQKSTPNDYLLNDSAVFTLDLGDKGDLINNREEEKRIINDFKIIFLNKKIKPGSLMWVNESSGRFILLSFRTIKDIIYYLTPKFSIFERETNDRMRYQKGKFILFYDYVSVNGNMWHTLNKGLRLIKRRIPIGSKDAIIDKIDAENPELKNSNLMNPYQIFKD
ncbi:MAG: FRG domain-containing protein [Acholeplasmataceae bacterium]|jgi:hypothetical protein